MIESQRETLFNPKREYVSVGISKGGVAYDITPVMWEHTSSAFNMKVPDCYIAPEDLQDEEIMNRISSLTVNGLYIYAPLDDYSFIARFTELRDLHIRNADGLKSLDFLRDIVDLGMIFLESATLPDIDIIWEIKASGRGFLPYRQVGLYDCNIARAPKNEGTPCRFTEFLVWSKPENAQRDRDMWQYVEAGTKRYYSLLPVE